MRAGTEADGAASANFWKIGAFPILFQKFALAALSASVPALTLRLLLFLLCCRKPFFLF